jgi:hypothetical protein
MVGIPRGRVNDQLGDLPAKLPGLQAPEPEYAARQVRLPCWVF